MWFEYGNSNRGQLTPYEFYYNTLNPDYSLNAFDRWGQYKPIPPSDPLMNHDFPYVSQVSDTASKALLDQQAAAWSLSEIRLPSGGKIMVDYEVDDYGYVQHKQAMQMAQLVDPYVNGTSAENNPSYNLSDSNFKVRFKLEKAIEYEMTSQEQSDFVKKHLDLNRKGQLYFKVLMGLRSPSEEVHEFVGGYVNVDLNATMALEKDGLGKYVYGSFHLKGEKAGGSLRHPFSLRAWQHLRVNQPDLANLARKIEPTRNNEEIDDNEKVAMMKGLASVIPNIRQAFMGFENYCAKKDWGRKVLLGRSWIRINSPDKVKYGGGLRVKQITMSDEWQHDSEGIYGQVYDYTTNEDGETISSGVAANEPLQGGDENALRYAKTYTESVPLRSDNQLFFEYPINESYYPGPQVGYGKVTVKSLAAAALAGETVLHNELPGGGPIFPEGGQVSFGTTGATVHEFYTAKDFPVIALETEKDNEPYQISIPVPLIGTINTSRLTTTQGYSVLTNDMHGKLKKVSYHRQAKNGQIMSNPFSWTAYHYGTENRYYEGQKVSVPDNQFVDLGDQLVEKYTPSSSGPIVYMGQEVEFFADMREHEDKSWSVGANANMDILLIPLVFVPLTIPIPSIWPAVSRNERQLRTVVTNKVIFRSGILNSIETVNEGSRTIVTHLKWDKLTGKPLLTQVNNNFDDPIYSYSLPAYTEYSGMGPAYQNIGYHFSIQNVSVTPYKGDIYSFVPSSSARVDLLRSGDEWILYALGSGEVLGRGTFIGEEEGELRFYSEGNLTASNYEVKIIRSGNRNQLSAIAESIQALQDPTQEGTVKSYSTSLTNP